MVWGQRDFVFVLNVTIKPSIKAVFLVRKRNVPNAGQKCYARILIITTCYRKRGRKLLKDRLILTNVFLPKENKIPTYE
jgi:hypothetical protein